MSPQGVSSLLPLSITEQARHSVFAQWFQCEGRKGVDRMQYAYQLLLELKMGQITRITTEAKPLSPKGLQAAICVSSLQCLVVDEIRSELTAVLCEKSMI